MGRPRDESINQSINIIRLACVTIALVFCGSVWAYDGWSTGRILKIRYQNTELLITQEGATNPGSCSNTNYIYLNQGDAGYLKNMYAALLASYATGRPVSLALTGCNPYPVVTEVWIQ